jgi:hypothetical protein
MTPVTITNITASTTSFTSQMLLTNYAARILARRKKKTESKVLTNAAPLLAGGLVEARLDMPLPIFSDIVLFHHLALLYFLPATRHETIQSH